MKTLLPCLSAIAFAGLMALPIDLGAAMMLILTAGMGAITLQDYSCRARLVLCHPASVAFPMIAQPAETNRLAA